MNVLQFSKGISCECFIPLKQEFSTTKEIYLDSKINSIIYPYLKCIRCYRNDSHLSIFARVARRKFSSSGMVLAQ